MLFEFATAHRILFGPGTFQQAGLLARDLGRQALVVTGGDTDRARPLLAQLAAQGIGYAVFPVPAEPTVEMARAGCRLAADAACNLVIAFGGGSAIDAGKAIAALAANGGDPLDYLEVIGRGQPLARTALPTIAIPTTAGTGAEVTKNAVLASTEQRVKASLRSPTMLPRAAIVDPELTYSLPPAITASTGLDALTQLIEPFTSSRANPLADGFCREGIVRAARALRRAYKDGSDIAARQDMALASLLGGLALANAGLGAAHGFAGPIGGMFQAPHGAVCAALLPHVMDVNLAGLRARQPNSPALARYTEIARLVTGSEAARPEDGIAWVKALAEELGAPPLRGYGITAAEAPMLVEKAAAASSTKANPIALTPAELTEILMRAL